MMKDKLPIFLTFLFSLFIAPIPVSSSQSHEVDWYCWETVGNYTADSPYKENLNVLFTSLTSKASGALFGHDSAGVGADEANMLYICRGDLNGQHCQACIGEAAQSILDHCPNQKEAIIWFEECVLRYANRTIFNLEEENLFTWRYSTTANVSDPLRFGQVLVNTLGGLIKDAAYNESKGGFAIGQGNLPLSVASDVSTIDKVYCLAQCTPDILGTRCERCLRAAFSAIAGCCGTTRQSVLLYFPSCQLRYSIFPFIRETSPPISPANFSPPPSPNIESSSGAAARMLNFKGYFLMLGLITVVNTFAIVPIL